MATILEVLNGKLEEATGKTIADALDELSGSEETHETIAEAIGDVPTGGDGAIVPTGGVNIVANGETLVASYEYVYVHVPAYLIQFNVNGGTGTVTPIACAYGDTKQLPVGTGITPPSQKEFAGWATTSSATVSDVITEYRPQGDTTLYAVWDNA